MNARPVSTYGLRDSVDLLKAAGLDDLADQIAWLANPKAIIDLWGESIPDVIKAVHRPRYASNNSFYFVYPDGSWGSRKPLNMGPRTWHEFGPACINADKWWWDGWPMRAGAEKHDREGRAPVMCKTSKDATRLVNAMLKSAMAMTIARFN